MLTGKYKWIKGENAGTVEDITGTVDEWVEFQSGRRINKEILYEYMVSLENGNQTHEAHEAVTVGNNYDFSSDSSNNDIIEDPDTGERIDIRQLRIREKSSKKITSKPNTIGQPTVQSDVHINVEEKEVKKESPITILINQSRKDSIKVSYEFDIDIPKKDVYGIINQNFDIDLNETILSIVLASIDKNVMNDDIKFSVENAIINHYKTI